MATTTPATGGLGPASSVQPAAASASTPAPGTGVRITTDKARYAAGEPVVVTISNDLAHPIFAALGQSYCTIVALQRLDNGAWATEGACPGGVTPAAFTIAAQSAVTGALGPAGPAPGVQGPIVGGPVVPKTPEQDLRRLPTVTPPPAGQPAREVPQGQLPPAPAGPPRLPGSTLQASLAPGTYRIQLSFTVASPAGPSQTVASACFVVAG